MKILIVLFLVFLTACGDPCAPRRDCIKGHWSTYLMPIYNGDTFSYIPMDEWICDEYGPVYKPEGCK